MKGEWLHIGDVVVDGGRILIIDPGSLRDALFFGVDRVEQWYDKEVVANADKPYSAIVAPVLGQGQPLILGQVVTSGYGDDVYPVEVRMTSDNRVAEVRIKFIDSE